MSDKRIDKIDRLLGSISASYAPSEVADGVYEVRKAMLRLEKLVEIERLKKSIPSWMWWK